MTKDFDVVGVGLNATDTMLLVPRFPAYGGKVPFHHEVLSPGGQVASAMVTCARLGLRARYIGTVGDDERGEIQMQSLLGSGVDLALCAAPQELRQPIRVHHYRPIDRRTHGVLESAGLPGDCAGRHYAGPDHQCAHASYRRALTTRAVEHAARIARENGIPVTVDVDTIYPGFERVLPLVDYLIASSEFPARWTRIEDPHRALQALQGEYGMRVAAMTLGSHGALALSDGEFYYSAGYVVPCLDTTGAGDVFHGAFCYSVLKGMSLPDALDFSNAMAALNCTAIGAARGNPECACRARNSCGNAGRNSNPDFTG